jgi:hypothetical protein
MLSYPLTWTPVAVFLAIVVVLTIPFLGPVLLLFAMLGALVAFIRAIVATSRWPGRSVRRGAREHAEGHAVCVSPPAQQPVTGLPPVHGDVRNGPHDNPRRSR